MKSWSCSRKRAFGFAVLPAAHVALVMAALLSHSVAWIAVARGQTIAQSQVPGLLDCQAAWGVTFNQWQEGGDCSQADGLTCDSNGMITSMVLDDMGLSGSLPTSLGSFINLSYLSLWSNSLTGELPSTITALTALSDIVLEFNQLAGSLPQGLSTLSRLSRLSLGNNRFASSLPDWIGGLSLLETLDVSRNNLSGPVPSSIGNLLNLTFLGLEYNAFTAALPASLGSLTTLAYLNVDNTSLTCPTTPASCEVPQDPLSVFCVNCATFCSQCSAAGKPLCSATPSLPFFSWRLHARVLCSAACRMTETCHPLSLLSMPSMLTSKLLKPHRSSHQQHHQYQHQYHQRHHHQHQYLHQYRFHHPNHQLQHQHHHHPQRHRHQRHHHHHLPSAHPHHPHHPHHQHHQHHLHHCHHHLHPNLPRQCL
ncbi:unnamed protein product [Closterium sp. NIES-53]